MALTVNAEPLSPACNSYISIADADSYVIDRVPDAAVQTAWDGLDTEKKALYLVRASAFLDGLVTWIGDRYSRDQRLKWPRFNAWVDGYYLNDTTGFPEAVTFATVEMALFTMQQEGAVAESNSNARYQEIEVGPLRIDFNNQGTGPADKYFPDIIAILLKDLGTIDNPDLPGLNKAKNMRLDRA